MKTPRNMNEAFGPYSELRRDDKKWSWADVYLTAFVIGVMAGSLWAVVEQLAK